MLCYEAGVAKRRGSLFSVENLLEDARTSGEVPRDAPQLGLQAALGQLETLDVAVQAIETRAEGLCSQVTELPQLHASLAAIASALAAKPRKLPPMHPIDDEPRADPSPAVGAGRGSCNGAGGWSSPAGRQLGREKTGALCSIAAAALGATSST
jgi:hypothetical protein